MKDSWAKLWLWLFENCLTLEAWLKMEYAEQQSFSSGKKIMTSHQLLLIIGAKFNLAFILTNNTQINSCIV